MNCYKAQWKVSGLFSVYFCNSELSRRRKQCWLNVLLVIGSSMVEAGHRLTPRFTLATRFLSAHSCACSASDKHSCSVLIPPKPYPHAHALLSHLLAIKFPCSRCQGKNKTLYVPSPPCFSICPLTSHPRSTSSISTPKLKAEHPQAISSHPQATRLSPPLRHFP